MNKRWWNAIPRPANHTLFSDSDRLEQPVSLGSLPSIDLLGLNQDKNPELRVDLPGQSLSLEMHDEDFRQVEDLA